MEKPYDLQTTKFIDELAGRFGMKPDTFELILRSAMRDQNISEVLISFDEYFGVVTKKCSSNDQMIKNIRELLDRKPREL